MKKPSSRNIPLILNLNESLSNSNSSINNIRNSKASSKNKNKFSSSSSSRSSKRTILNSEHRKNISGFFKYTDKVEKRMYLENINIKTKRNTELLSKLSSTYRAMHSNSKDPLIESNLFKIGAKRSFLLSKRMNQVRNMIQDFDNEFTVNLNINKNNKKFLFNKNGKKNSLQKIEEESFDFDLNNINSKNESKIDSDSNNNSKNSKKSLKKNSLMIKTNFFDIEDLKNKMGKKFIKYQKKFEKKLNNSEKFLQLTDAFKYYELLYNYKYFLTKKDNELLSFSRRRKLERAFSSYYPIPKSKLFNYEESCEKCNEGKKKEYQQYRDSLKINLSNSGLISYEDNNNYNNTQREKINIKNKKLELSLENSQIQQKNLKRAFSGFMSKKTNNKNLLIINPNNSNKIRPTSSTISQTIQSANYSYSNQFNSKKNDLDLYSVMSDISSFNNNQNTIYSKKSSNINQKKNKIFLIKQIKNLSEGIINKGGKLKTEMKSKYKSIMKLLEEEKKPVTKVKKDRNINIKNIRKDLNLRRRGNGIDEKKLIMDNVNKLYKSLPKTHVNLMRSIAKIVINEDRMRHRPLFYNDTYDNKLFKKRLKNEMFEAQCEMGKIRQTLSKNKKKKDFKQQIKKLMTNEMFLFFNNDSLKQMLNKYKVLRGECLGNT